MSRVEWRDVEDVLAAVIDLPLAERSARIGQLCRDRAELRDEVESLLMAHERAASFLELDTKLDSSRTQRSRSKAERWVPINCLPSSVQVEWERFIGPSAPTANSKSRWRSK